jgi:uncharacterized repeat protein (TIGR03803 family)
VRQKKSWFIAIVALSIIVVALVLAPDVWAASTYTVLHKFTGADGRQPYADLILDGAGNLYGTTQAGGPLRCGNVFKLTPNSDGTWTETVLHTFTGPDGCNVLSRLIFDAAGNLYGTAYTGGAQGYGTVFKLTPESDGTWSVSVLYNFCSSCAGGGNPGTTLIFDASGNLYGTTTSGYFSHLNGTVFKLTPNPDGSWTESVLYTFNRPVRNLPIPGGLIFDAAGNLYGTTQWGGKIQWGSVFKLAPNPDGTWTMSVLHSFCSRKNCTDGALTGDGVIFDASGNLYGVTMIGGAQSQGTVFQLTPNPDGSWTERVLHNFAYHPASGPRARLIFDLAGNLYGTASPGDLGAGGTVFKLTPNSDGSRAFSVLHVFTGKPALLPFGGLAIDKAGSLYGTTSTCARGTNCYGRGVAFEITP